MEYPRNTTHPNNDCFSFPASFDFASSREFLKHFKAIQLQHLPSVIRFNLRHTHYIDTAGLGVILLLGEHAGRNRKIIIDEAHGDVRAILEVALIQERLSGTHPCNDFDLRACAQCGHTAQGQCRGTLDEIRHCASARPGPRRHGATPAHARTP